MTPVLLLLLLLVQVPAGLQAQTGIVTGILRTDTGIPLEGVRVAVAPADQPIGESVLESQGLTDSAGRYRLENVSPGRYNILIRRRSRQANENLFQGANIGPDRAGSLMYHPGVTDVGKATTVLVLAGSTIEVPDMVFGGNVIGRVVDMATGLGRRIENLVLCCDYSQPVLLLGPTTVVSAAVFATPVSDDGSFVFPAVPPGNYVLSTADPSVVSVSWALAVGKNGATGLQLDVTEGVEVQGTVLDQAGVPVSAPVRLRPKPTNSAFNTIGPPTNTAVKGWLLIPKSDPSLDGLQDRLLKSANVRSGSLGPDGRFEFQKVFPGTYVLEVNTTGVAVLEREIQVGAAGLTNLSLQASAIHVAGRVIAPSGSPLPKLNYIRLIRSGSDADVFYAFPDTDGHFSFVLLPGQYRVFTEKLGPVVQSVSDGSRDITNREFTFEGVRNPQIVVTLEP